MLQINQLTYGLRYSTYKQTQIQKRSVVTYECMVEVMQQHCSYHLIDSRGGTVPPSSSTDTCYWVYDQKIRSCRDIGFSETSIDKSISEFLLFRSENMSREPCASSKCTLYCTPPSSLSFKWSISSRVIASNRTAEIPFLFNLLDDSRKSSRSTS